MASQESYDVQQLLKTAITMEEEASKNYMDAAKVVTSADVCAVFEKLAKQENAHQAWLTQVFNSFTKAHQWTDNVDAPQELVDTARANLFTDAVKNADPNTYAKVTDAIRRGIKMEVDSIAFYKGVASVAKDSVAKNMFNTLAIWEGEHLFILEYWLHLQNT